MWFDKFARFGYVTKGFVYCLLSFLAAEIAIAEDEQVAQVGKVSTSGALEAIAIQPFGRLLLSVVAIGLMSYALWRFLQAALDPRHSQRKPLEKIFVRLGYILSGLSYAGLSISATEMILRVKQGNNNSPSDWTAQLLELPFGRWLVGILGLAIIVVGFSYFRHAFKAKSDLHLDLPAMRETIGVWIIGLGRLGIATRGIVFGLVGFFLLQAALKFDPQEAKGLDGILHSLAQQKLGKSMLVIIAFGLFTYSIYMFVEARFRQMKPLEVLTQDFKRL